MVFWLVVWMAMLVMFQAGGNIGKCTRSRDCGRRDTTRGIGVACVVMLCFFRTGSQGFTVSICHVAVCSGPICAEFDALLDFHRLLRAALCTLNTSPLKTVAEGNDKQLVGP